MVNFTVTILGNGSAVPTSFQHPTSQLINYNGKRFLIDCGEGTQMQMIKYNTGHKHIDHIFISHLHGDHFYGFIGIINTLHLFGREKPLYVYAPKLLKEIIDVQLEASGTTLKFPLIYTFIDEVSGIIYEDKNLTVEHFPLKHRIPTFGFIFKEKKRERKINKEFINEYSPSIEQIHLIKQGHDFITEEGKHLPNLQITVEPYPLRSYAYCSDTGYYEKIIPFIKGVSLLYHESTFSASQQKLALEKFHSTTKDAATIALKANAGRLLLGHFSARFREKNELLSEAKEIFENSLLSEEGVTYNV
jgi:ribonuclease Z